MGVLYRSIPAQHGLQQQPDNPQARQKHLKNSPPPDPACRNRNQFAAAIPAQNSFGFPVAKTSEPANEDERK